MKTDLQELLTGTDPSLVESICEIAEAEGRESQAVLEEALREYVDSHQGKPLSRSEVMGHARTSIERNRRLGELLAK